MPTVILANRYNTLRDQVNLILGSSTSVTPTYGYGQSFTTQSVTGTGSVTDPLDADKISAEDYENLYIDLIRIRAHQLGASSVTINPFVVGDYDINLEDTDKVEEIYMQGLESLATDIDTDKFLVDATTQLSVSALLDSQNAVITSTRYNTVSGNWNGTINHIFQVTFASAIARQEFFNAGGQIRCSANVAYTGSQAKTVDWQTRLSAMGAISFKANATSSSTGAGTGYSIGNYQLGSAYQKVYRQTGGSVYTRNDYELFAREVNATTIQFKASFTDDAPNNTTWGIDETVLGDFSSIAEVALPNGQVNINGTDYDTVVISTPPVGSLLTPLGNTIPVPPTITSFTALPSSISSGSSSTLSWTILNGTSASINRGIGTVNSSSGSTVVGPTSSTTYTLTATNSDGTDSATATVSVVQPPVINSFGGASSATIGSSIGLSWNVSNATTLILSADDGSPSVTVTGATGTENVTISNNITYTLTASNAAGTVSATHYVAATQDPPTPSISFNDSGVDTRSSTLLSWTSGGGTTTTVTVTNHNGTTIFSSNLTSGNETITPTGTGTYTANITTSNSWGNGSYSTTFEGVQAPSISYAASTVEVNNSVTYSWNAGGYTSSIVSIIGSNGITYGVPNGTDLIGSATSTPALTGTWTVRISPNGYPNGLTSVKGATYVEDTIVVTSQASVLTAASWDQAQYNSGDTATFNWTLDPNDTNASVGYSLVGSPINNTSGSKTGSNSVSITVSGRGSIAGAASYDGVNINDSATVIDIPSIVYFTAGSSSITSGDSTTLSWVVQYADTVTIDQGIGSVNASSGATTISPTTNTTYTLTATNGAGSVTTSQTVNVGSAAPSPTMTITAPSSAYIGDPFDFSWSATNATSTTRVIVGVLGNSITSPGTATSGTQTIPAQNSVGTVAISGTATGAGGTVAANTVETTIGYRPNSASITPNPIGFTGAAGTGQSDTYTIAVSGTPGDTVNISWTYDRGPFTGNNNVILDSNGEASGSGVHTDWGTFTYVFTFGVGSPSSITVVQTINPPAADPPTISLSPSSGAINSDNFTLTWNSYGTGTVASLYKPNGILHAQSTDATGSVVGPLNVVGTWSASISDSAGSDSASTTVTYAPSLTISPSSVEVNEPYTVSLTNAEPNGTYILTVYGTLYPGGQPWSTSGTSVTFNADSSGNYTVSNQVHTGEIDYYITLSGTSSIGGSTTSNTLQVRYPPPSGSIQVSPSSGVANSTTFTVAWSYSNANNVYIEYFKDGVSQGSFSPTLNPSSLSQTLSSAGTWSFSLIDDSGTLATDSVLVTATPPPTVSGQIYFDASSYQEGDSAVAIWSTSNTTTTVTAYMYRDLNTLVVSGNGTSGQLVFDTAGYPGSSLTAVLAHGTDTLDTDNATIDAATGPTIGSIGGLPGVGYIIVTSGSSFSITLTAYDTGGSALPNGVGTWSESGANTTLTSVNGSQVTDGTVTGTWRAGTKSQGFYENLTVTYTHNDGNSVSASTLIYWAS